MYTDIDGLFERWAIMTVDGGQGDNEAMHYCLTHCDPAIAQAFIQYVEKIIASKTGIKRE